MSVSVGSEAEDLAKLYLQNQGLQWVESNFRSKMGEIDLIMRDREVLVFVEVRKRTSPSHGKAIESITYQKQQKIVKTALLYLQQKKLLDRCTVRFDVVCIEGKPLQLNWIPNAFSE